MSSSTRACAHINARRQTDRETGGRTDSHIRHYTRAYAHTRTLACLHAHTMHSGTYARTESHTHTCSYGGKHPSTNMEVRTWKLEVRIRNKKCRACIDERTHVKTNIWTHEQARGQTDRQIDGRTDGWTDSNIRLHARAHANTRTRA